MKKLRVAVVQMNSGEDKEKNLKKAKKLIEHALKKKPELICLPEVFNFRGNLLKAADAAEPIPGYSTNFIAKLAKKHHVWILIGSIMERVEKHKKPYNTLIVINPKGKVIAKYRKMHIFDVNLNGKLILESSRNRGGNKPQLVSIGNKKKVKVGLSVCYDLRFPELYRYYSKKGAEILCLAASFVKVTGRTHWHMFLKARAVENQCYVIAPAQCGSGSAGLKTLGHSLIIDPWGRILEEAPGNKEAVIFAELDFNYLRELRKNLPFLKHRKIH